MRASLHRSSWPHTATPTSDSIEAAINQPPADSRQRFVSTYRILAQASDCDVVDAFRRDRAESAARVLIERFSPRLLRTAGRVLGDHASAADDVVQDGWIRALGAIDSYRADAAFGTWMTRIVIRTALDHLRRLDTRTPLLSLEEARGSAVAPLIDHDLAADIDAALTRLSTNARSVFVMHDIEGFSHQEIADELGIAVGTSKVHLFNARRKLRAMLRDVSDEGATA
jgi:RNA polymerase sigma-70 factor (ECF subfamily)